MENELVRLIASDRLETSLSCMYQRVRKEKTELGESLAKNLGSSRYQSKRVFAFTEKEDKERARRMKDALAEFASEHPKYAAILATKLARKRKQREVHLHFGTYDGARLSSNDYLHVMESIGISENVARNLYPQLLVISRKLDDGNRSLIVG